MFSVTRFMKWKEVSFTDYKKYSVFRWRYDV